MFGIRVDANEHIASGHVMRCLSIADALFPSIEILFITSDNYAEEMVSNRGYRVLVLNSNWDDKESELELLLSAIDLYQINVLLVDSYQVTSNYLKTLRNAVKLVYLDDLDAFDYPADVVVNYSIGAKYLDYPHNKVYLLGTRYTPLREQFNILDYQIDQAIMNRNANKYILITTGASDPYRVAPKVAIEVLKQDELSEYGVVVISGKFHNKAILSEELSNDLDCNQKARVKVLENVENMADIMLNCSMAVSAGGSTLYELCACCVPTVIFSHEDNQRYNAKAFSAAELMEYAGDARDTSLIQKSIVCMLIEYHNNIRKKEHMIRKMKGLDCRHGANELAKQLIKLIKDSI